MSEKYITQVEKKIDKIRDEIYDKVKDMTWVQYKNYLNRRTRKFAKDFGVKLSPTQTPGAFSIRW